MMNGKQNSVMEDLLTKNAAEIPQADALVFKDRRISWKEYAIESDRAAMGLLKLGVRKGDRVGIYMPNWPEFLFVYLGAAKIGAVAVPISWRFTPQEIKFIINNSEVSVLVMASGFMGMDFVRNIESIRPELPTLKQVVILDKEKDLAEMIQYDQFATKPGPALATARAAVRSEDAVLFIYTSGTTGVPKAAVLTHKNLISYSRAHVAATGFTRGLSLLLNIPLNHSGGAVMAVMACLTSGNKLVLMDLFDPEKTLQIIQDEKISCIGQVPAQYAMELLSPNVDKYDLSSIKVAVVSSQPCPSELIVAIKQRMGVMPLNAYGLTESTGTITLTHPEDGEEKLKYTVGTPFPGVEVSIMDQNNNILAQGQEGEVVIKGDVVMKGYWKRPDEDARVMDHKGYLHTGDMGKMDKEGYLVIIGRKKEMFIRGGENVYPPEVEEAISQHPDVFMVAVLGRPDPIMGEAGRAYIIRKPGTSSTAEEIKAFLKDRLARYKIPEDIIFRDQLPFTPLGKVKKLTLYEEINAEFGRK
jgi:acyl-CoA synthetase (AMP-forming)/AMP-acid ligase II